MLFRSLRPTPNRSTQYTPFFMVYGAEAVLPCDIKFDAPRVVRVAAEDLCCLLIKVKGKACSSNHFIDFCEQAASLKPFQSPRVPWRGKECV